MLSRRPFLVLPLLAAILGTVSATASTDRVEASVQTIQVVENGSVINVQFRITVTNRESSPASDVFVIFDDGQQVALSDVDPDASVRSGIETRSIDVSTQPSHSIPVTAKLKFVLNGVSVERAQTLVFFRPPAAQ
jgi:hypothetical protein